MSHRGPDAAGLWDGGHVILGHRRLAVIAPGPEGAQPMHAGDGPNAGTLVYNGELYNDAEVRAAMWGEGAQRAVPDAAGSDTRTVLAWLEAADDPVAALARLRGMFALAYVDAQRGRLVLARDCLGIKPLYYTARRCGERAEVIFASEAGVVAGAPGVSARPDWGTVSSYLTTIRTTMGERTMFEGVTTLLPGEVLTFDLRDAGLRMTRARLGVGPRGGAVRSAAEVAEVVRDSVRRHLRSDVPVCCLLSGGLDSTIITGVCVSEGVVPRTYAAGAMGDEGERVGDLAYAWRTARALGTDHAEAVVDGEMFVSRVREMIDRTGMVMSTPNEVAINEVARRLRRDGCVVALSGEGADELFGGYEWPMRSAAEFVERVPRATAEEAAAHHIGEGAWIEPGRKGLVLRENVLKRADGDEGLRAWYTGEMAGAMEESDGEAMQAHLSFMRRVNLTGLLMRLDSATMLEGVEGRTPFADGTVAAAAMGLPMSMKYERSGGRGRTKIVLRAAFAGVVPGEVLTREKASFPLPFQEWCGGLVEGAMEGAWAREVFEEVAVEAVKRVPAEAWRLAWPMLNLGLWGQKWWG
jgi:asparagine synthase (glutamine-hydrolysing)